MRTRGCRRTSSPRSTPSVRAWVDRLKQRRRETGEVAPRKQTRWRTPVLHAQLTELAALIREQPDRTLAELQEALRTPASLPTLCRTIKRLGFRFKKKRCTRRNTIALTSRRARTAWRAAAPTLDPARLVFSR